MAHSVIGINKLDALQMYVVRLTFGVLLIRPCWFNSTTLETVTMATCSCFTNWVEPRDYMNQQGAFFRIPGLVSTAFANLLVSCANPLLYF